MSEFNWQVWNPVNLIKNWSKRLQIHQISWWISSFSNKIDHYWSLNQHFNWKKIENCINFDIFNQIVVEFDRKLSSLFYQNLISTLKSKSLIICRPNLDSLESESSTIRFRTPNCLSFLVRPTKLTPHPASGISTKHKFGSA